MKHAESAVTGLAPPRRITVRAPLVEMDGDEMARIVWRAIKEKIIAVVFDLNIDYYDLSIQNRDRTGDAVTLEAARATLKHGVAVKCATITADAGRVREFSLRSMWRSPNATIRGVIGGTVFREPILCANVPRLVPHWNEPIVIGRHAYGDIYNATDAVVPPNSVVELTITTASPTAGAPPERRSLVVHRFGADSGGVVMGSFNVDKSIDDFARSTFRYALDRRWPLFLSTKNTVLRNYDGRFRARFAHIFETEGFRAQFAAAGIVYEHRLIDDMVAHCLRSNGKFVWACKNYDGDVQSDMVAQGFGSLGLMTSILVSPDGRTFESEAAHGTVTTHFRQHQRGEETSTNPVASIYSWTRGIARRAALDGTPMVARAAELIERATMSVIESGKMTKDLALIVHGADPARAARPLRRDEWLNTFEMLDAIAAAVTRDWSAFCAAHTPPSKL